MKIRIVILNLILLILFSLTTATFPTQANTAKSAATNGRILMFVAYNDVWWTEYKVAYEGLKALGYEIDVVSSSTGEAYTYGGGVDNSIQTTFGEFETLFQNNFGIAWDSNWTAQNTIPLDGRIQDIDNLDDYDAVVMPGGKGTIAYRYDGTYAALSPEDAPGTHVTTAEEVQAATEKLNELINMALQAGKPVGAQCHGAPLAAFARVDGTAGDGFDGLGVSVLAGKYATGFALDGTVATDYANLGITYLVNEKLVLDGPDALHYGGNGIDRMVTTLDWRAETVSYFASTIHNMLTSYPTPAHRTRPIDVLVFGGDEPANYLPQQPARYTDLVTLLNDAGDDLNITAVGTDDPNDITLANLQNYDVLLYFGHDQVSQPLQDAVVDFVDGGGGLVGLHHAIYNHNNGKNTLIDLFGGELPSTVLLNNEMGLVYTDEENRMINVNLGHFVSTYGVHLTSGQPTTTTNYSTPLGVPNTNLDNDNSRGYYHFTINAPDELYLGSQFNDSVVFGSGVNQINRLFANDRTVDSSPNPNNGHYDTWGWTKRYDSGDGTEGRIVYLQPGETNDRTLAHPAYEQVIKNAIIWAALANINHAPNAISDHYILAANETLIASAPGILGNDSDVETLVLTVTDYNPATNGTISIKVDGALTYTPTLDFIGTEVISYTISDGALTDTANIWIEVWATVEKVYLPVVIRQ